MAWHSPCPYHGPDPFSDSKDIAHPQILSRQRRNALHSSPYCASPLRVLGGLTWGQTGFHQTFFTKQKAKRQRSNTVYWTQCILKHLVTAQYCLKSERCNSWLWIVSDRWQGCWQSVWIAVQRIVEKTECLIAYQASCLFQMSEPHYSKYHNAVHHKSYLTS